MTIERAKELLNQEKEELLKEENPDREHLIKIEIALTVLEYVEDEND